MATSARFGIELWPSDTDYFSRTQMHESHNKIEERGAIFRQDLLTNRGSASTWTRSFFYDTTNGVLYFSNGTDWKEISKYGTTTAKITPGSAASAGTSADVSRADHVHEVDSYGLAGEVAATGTAKAAGSTSKYARIDHVHTIGAGSVTAGALAVNSISSPSAFVAGVVDTSALGGNAVTKEKISEDQQIPAGAIMPYVGATAPTGWLLCDGTSYAKASYPALWSVLGTQNYGSNTNNFNVPDLRDRIPRGAATTSTTLGVTAGADNVTLSTNQIPAHNHDCSPISVSNGSHTHSVNGSTNGSEQVLNHRHSISHTHTGDLQSTLITGGTGSYGNLFLSPGSGSGIYASGQAANGSFEIVQKIPLVANSAISTSSQSTSNSGYVDLTNHTHTVDLMTGVNLAYVATVSGSTANNVTTGSSVDLRPKTQTVNYIIKT
jgi:microcystin-dependent protein